MHARIIILTTVLLFTACAAPGLRATQPTTKPQPNQHANPEPPRVVRIEPDLSAPVHPGGRAIRVAFDRDMRTGSHSWVGGGDAFPTLRGAPYWPDRRTAVLPVTLKPDHTYQLALNSGHSTGFVSLEGVPLEPVPIGFRTGPAQAENKAETNPVDAIRIEARDDLLRTLRTAIDDHYSYRDRVVQDWDAVFARHRAAVLDAPDRAALARALGALLAEAQDPHVWLTADGQTFPSYRRTARTTNNVRATAQRLGSWTMLGRNAAWADLPDGTLYVLVASFDRTHQRDVRLAIDLIRSRRTAPALILDVRNNSGGDERLAKDLAALFQNQRAVYATNTTRDPAAVSGFHGPYERTIEPAPQRFEGPVAVLMGPQNMSSAEAFLLMMRQAPNAVLIGERSFGSSGNPRDHALPESVRVALPSWRAADADGNPFEGIGLEPDVFVPAPPELLRARDPVLDWVLEDPRRWREENAR